MSRTLLPPGREHLLFYARIKNFAGKRLRRAVDDALRSVNLFTVGNDLVGGYRCTWGDCSSALRCAALRSAVPCCAELRCAAAAALPFNNDTLPASHSPRPVPGLGHNLRAAAFAAVQRRHEAAAERGHLSGGGPSGGIPG